MVPQLTDAAAPRDSDLCVSFLINDGAFRGRFVRLSATVSEILRRHDDPPAVGALLAETMAAAIALAGGLKYEGVFTLQTQGDGPVSMLVVDITSGGNLRAWAKFDPDSLAAEIGHTRAGGLPPHLLGAGHLAFTVDQGPDTERYQGIVELTGGSLADSIHHYFRQSEQLDSALKLAVARPPEGQAGPWTAAALLIQRMPEEGGERLRAPTADLEDDWRAAVILLGSMKDSELLDPDLSAAQLLRRVYGTVGVRPLQVRPIHAVCRCSRDRSARIIASFPMDELRTLADHDKVSMTCEFCREVYTFPLDELDRIARESSPPQHTGSAP